MSADLSIAELEYRLLYSMAVAGKSAEFADSAMSRFLRDTPSGTTPFQYVRWLADNSLLTPVLRGARTGNYTKLTLGFRQAAEAAFDLRTISIVQLEAIHGIGPKTSRFFILWTREDANFAALDTHILKWLRYIGHSAPKATPSKAKYAALEKVMLAEAEARGMTARELDSAIWDWCRAGRHRDGEWPESLKKRPAHDLARRHAEGVAQ